MPHERFCCCCGYLANEPCGFPAGTIRSTLAIIITIFAFIGIITSIVFLLIYQQWAIAVAIAEAVLGVLGTVTGFYFGKRSGDKEPDQLIMTPMLDRNGEPLRRSLVSEELVPTDDNDAGEDVELTSIQLDQ